MKFLIVWHEIFQSFDLSLIVWHEIFCHHLNNQLSFDMKFSVIIWSAIKCMIWHFSDNQIQGVTPCVKVVVDVPPDKGHFCSKIILAYGAIRNDSISPSMLSIYNLLIGVSIFAIYAILFHVTAENDNQKLKCHCSKNVDQDDWIIG